MFNVGLVDDNGDSRALVRYWLELNGYEVRDRCRAHDLLGFLSEETVVVILIDLRLAEMDGLALAEEIRKNRDGSVPLIALTGHALPAVREQAAAVGFEEFLTKPVDLDVLIQTI